MMMPQCFQFLLTSWPWGLGGVRMHLCIQRKTMIFPALPQLYLTAYLDHGAGENEKSKGMPRQSPGSPNRTRHSRVICQSVDQKTNYQLHDSTVWPQFTVVGTTHGHNTSRLWPRRVCSTNITGQTTGEHRKDGEVQYSSKTAWT